jgi:Tol biopolymer transport system component
MGLDAGSLYVMRSGAEPVAIGDVGYLSCLGHGTFRFTPDSSKMVYMSFDETATQRSFAAGFLKVVETATLNAVLSRENVSAFDVTDDGVLYVSLFTNDRDEADEAAVVWWDGSSEREVATLLPQTDCYFTSVEATISPSGAYILSMGHRCRAGETRTSWQLYTVDPDSRSAALAGSDFAPGAFATHTRSNYAWFSPDGSTLYFTVPDGLTANSVAIAAAEVSDMSISVVVERQAIFPTFSGSANAYPSISADGSWMALTVTSPNADNNLFALGLTNPDVPPIVIGAGSRGDTVSALGFTPDSDTVVFVAGGDEGDNNSLFELDLASASETRIARGRFGSQMALSPDGSQIALIDWQVLEDEPDPAYVNLVIAERESGSVATVFTGADVVDGEATNLRFASPLTWMKSS